MKKESLRIVIFFTLFNWNRVVPKNDAYISTSLFVVVVNFHEKPTSILYSGLKRSPPIATTLGLHLEAPSKQIYDTCGN